MVAKSGQNENHLMLLAIIAKMDREKIDTDVEKLAELGKFFKSHVEYVIENLIEEGLVAIDDRGRSANIDEAESGGRASETAPRDEPNAGKSGGPAATVTIELPRQKRLVEAHDFSVTQKGMSLLEDTKKELARLSVAMQRLYNTKNRDELYRAIFWNREWLPLMLYTGVLTTTYLSEMMRFLGVDLHRLSLTEMQDEADHLGIGPFVLSAALFIVHPLLAIASYIVSMITMRKLEEQWKIYEKPVEMKDKPPGSRIYIPEAT